MGKVNKIVENFFHNQVIGVILILVGLITLGGGQIGLQVTPTSEIQWITAFSNLPKRVAWIIIWFGFDTVINGILTNYIVTKLITPVVNAILENILGVERFNKLRQKFEGKKDTINV